MMKESPVAAAAESGTHAAGVQNDPNGTSPGSAQAPKTRAGDAQTGPAADAEESGVAAEASGVIAQIEKVMAAIRPAVQADKGDVELVSFDAETGIVEVELMGACQSCPASSATLKSGIERIMKDRVPSVTEVVNVGQVFYSDGTAVTL